ncbi:M20 family metallo-hydrolase [Nitratidesulfovibrio vulgaris]|uniref:M20 family metallo-hydrolase n=1 Tax=Nitratidesulfovibrio vulgaris TaxID=881 RepID=UPI0023003E69|nr:M20 family metallo-hydrolase [Nitratidesulfovibrio vulgaris]WCB45414.1 M20 family metallo-hydrolase [Nitratidesulfovibrio vulgaris]
MSSQLLSRLDNLRDRVIELQRNMTALPALGPESGGEGERAKADYLLSVLRDMGMPLIEVIDAPDPRVPCGHRPNIAARIPGRTGRTLWVIGHMDVVPPGEAALWDTDPWQLKVDGDIIFGRGVEDNQQGIVTGLLVAQELLASGTVPDMGFGLLLVADEETGNNYGMAHVATARPDLFGDDDLVIVPDFGTEDGAMIEIAEKSMLWLKVQVAGKQCHASTPDEGINSLVAASAMILRVHELDARFDAVDPLFNPPASTFVPTKKEANVPNVNTVPGNDVFYIDCRVLPCYLLTDVRQAVREIADDIERAYGVTVTLSDVQAEQAAPATSSDSDVVHRLTRAIRAEYGVEARPMGVGGGTVGAILRKRGLPVAVWSTLVPNPHTPNEASRISRTIGDAKVVARMLFDA